MYKYTTYDVITDTGAKVFMQMPAEDDEKFQAWVKHTDTIASLSPVKGIRRLRHYETNRPPKTKIGEARHRARMTQVEVSQRMGCRYSQYQKWEYGQIVPHVTTLMKLGEVLGVDWHTLVPD